jgi:hypothetical protein
MTDTPRCGTTLWSVRKESRTLSAEVRFEAGGFDIWLIVKDRRSGRFSLDTRSFVDGDQALLWANEQLNHHLRLRWKALPVVRERPI